MAIKTVQNKDGRIFHEVRVEARSKIKNIRVHRYRRLESLEEAKRAEKALLKECYLELEEKKTYGPKWEELVESWFQYSMKYRAQNPYERLSVETLVDYRATLMKWTRPLNGKPSFKLDEYEFQKLFHTMQMAELSRVHRRRVRRLITEVFQHGIRNDLIPRMFRNPVENIYVGKGRGMRREALTINQVNDLIRLGIEQKHKWVKVWAFAYLSLMRSQEMYALPWENVIFEERRLLVNRSFSIKRKRALLTEAKKNKMPPPEDAGFKPTKTEDWHYVPFNDDLEKLLLEQKEITGGTKYVFARDNDWECNKLARSLRKFCVKNNIPSICLHSLRACGATHLLQYGLEPILVMRLGGWKSLRSMQHYIRQSGIDVQGLNTSLRVLPTEAQANVFPFRIKATEGNAT